MYPVDINVVNDKLVQWIVQRNRESMQSLTSNSASPYETDQYQDGIYARKLDNKLEGIIYTRSNVSETHLLVLLMLRSGRVMLLNRGLIESKS